MRDFLCEAKQDAENMFRNFVDEIVDLLCKDGSVDIQDIEGIDTYLEDRVIENFHISVEEADNITDTFEKYHETDSGLWGKEKPREAFISFATCTYRNVVVSLFCSLISDLNKNTQVKKMLKGRKTPKLNEQLRKLVSSMEIQGKK